MEDKAFLLGCNFFKGKTINFGGNLPSVGSWVKNPVLAYGTEIMVKWPPRVQMEQNRPVGEAGIELSHTVVNQPLRSHDH